MGKLRLVKCDYRRDLTCEKPRTMIFFINKNTGVGMFDLLVFAVYREGVVPIIGGESEGGGREPGCSCLLASI